jgi:DNA-binding MarR family transcriptional regulator
MNPLALRTGTGSRLLQVMGAAPVLDAKPSSKAPADPTILFTLFNEVGMINQLAEAACLKVMPHGLSLAGFGVLNRFVRVRLSHDSPSRMTGAYQVTKGAKTNTVTRLDAFGFVTGEANPEDGPSKIVRLTTAG